MAGASVTRHPSPTLQQLLPRDIALRVGTVVLAEEGETLCLAVARPNDARLAATLAAAARRPVRLIGAGPGELAHALAACWDSDSAAGAPVAADARRLSALAHAVGVGYLLDARWRASGAPAALSESQQAAAEAAATRDMTLPQLSDGWGPEILGLLTGLPHLSIAAGPCPAPLRLLLPPHLRAPSAPATLAPLFVERGVLVVGCAAPPDEEALRAIAAWAGFEARPVLVEPAALRDISGDTPRGTVARGRDGDGGDGDDGDDDARRLAAAVARQTGEPVDEVARRLARPSAGSARKRERPSRPADDAAEILSVLPLPLLRSLVAAPSRGRRGALDMAIEAGRPDEADVAALFSALAGLRVRIRRVVAAEVRGLLRELSLGAIETRRAARGDTSSPRHPSAITPGTPDPSDGDASAALELLGARYNLPSIRLEHYHPAPELGEVMPPGAMERLRAVPVHREGAVLWVAVEAPDEDVLDELPALCGLTVRPVLATRDAILSRIAALAAGTKHAAEDAEDDVALDGVARDHPVLGRLQATGVLTGTDMVRVLADSARPVDEALHAAGILAHDEFAALAARLGGFDLADLALQAREEEVVDALGQRARRQSWHDPVDGRAADLLDAATAQRAGVLPLRQDGDALVVAVADPFAPATGRLLLSLGAAHPSGRTAVRVAPRPAILAALARARGRVSLGDLLLARGIVSAPELARALQLHRATGVRLGQALLHLGLVTQEQLAFIVAGQQDLPYYSLAGLDLDAALASLLPEEIERRLGVIPLYEVSATLVVATPDPLDGAALDEVAARTGRPVAAVVCTEADLQWALEELYRDAYLEKSTSELIARTPEYGVARAAAVSEATLPRVGVARAGDLFRPPAGWCMARAEAIDDWRPYFGPSAVAAALTMVSPTGARVGVQAILTRDAGAFGVYGVEDCYAFHGFALRAVHRVALGDGVSATLVDFAQGATPSAALYWVQPVRTPGGLYHERVVLVADAPDMATRGTRGTRGTRTPRAERRLPAVPLMQGVATAVAGFFSPWVGGDAGPAYRAMDATLRYIGRATIAAEVRQMAVSARSS